MLRQARCLLDSAEGESVVGRERVHCALVTGCHVGHYHTSLALQALRATIDKKGCDACFSFLFVVDLMDHRVDPAASLHVVKSCNYDLELTEEVFVELLNGCDVRRDLHSLDALHHESCGYSRLVLLFVELTLVFERL